MLNIGCHLSSAKGFLHMGKQAKSIGANTFQFFTRNPRGGTAKAMDPADAKALMDFMKENNFAPILAHAPYTLNPCAAKEDLRAFAKTIMRDDLERMEYLPGNLYNFHPRSHVKQGSQVGIALIAQQLNEILTPTLSTTVLLETMAGKGSEVGSTFEEIKEILDKVHCIEKMGVCLDTCHIFDGGYDIVSNLDEVLHTFDQVIGLSFLKAIHLNDSKNTLGSHKDRHETIGNGNIGLEAITHIINHPKLKHLPFYLETPNELEGYEKEIQLLRNCYEK